MAIYTFDIETDGLLDKMTTIHSLVLKDFETGQSFSFCDGFYKTDLPTGFVEDGVKMLSKADLIVGQNIINFDVPAIQKIFPWFSIEEDKVFDTMVASRLIWANLKELDMPRFKKGQFPGGLIGSHGLEAWGVRTGEWKGDYAKERVRILEELHRERGQKRPTAEEKLEFTWGQWNVEMQRYCEQDVEVTEKLYKMILERIDTTAHRNVTSRQALDMEHKVAHIIQKQVAHGFEFDEAKAYDLLRDLQKERAEVEGGLQSLFQPWYTFDGTKVPTRTVNYKDLTRHSETKGCEYSKVKLNVFNPSSRAHIGDRLMKLRGWKPTQFTSNGQPQIDDEILETLPYPEAQKIAYNLMLGKRIGQLFEGKNSWLNLLNSTTGRIHGSVNPNGAVTGRMTHSYPNVAQVPSVGKPFGDRCRELFTVSEGKKLVGVDVSGLELRMLAHFMAPHDGGTYGREVVDGDIHTVNMEAAGLPERNMAKTFIYAFLYGAGDEKIGSIVGKGRKHGGELKQRFLERTPALAKLISGVGKKARQDGFLRGLDGRRLYVRHQHAALNTLLQSAGALVCKRWAVEMDDAIKARGWEDRCQVVANIHDEHQYEVDEEIAEEVGQLSIECIKKAGEYFNIRVPLDGEANIGNNWKETH